MNTNVHVFSVSPFLTLTEKVTVEYLCQLFFGGESVKHGGFTCPGGSLANLTAMITARSILFPETKAKGIQDHKFRLFTSEHAHYSFHKAAMTAGMGIETVISVGVNSQGQMESEKLRQAFLDSKLRNETPFFVCATAGTTVYGSFDPLNEIADICEEFGLWLHVDASWGGGVIFSPKHLHKLTGIKRANSITFNPQKMLGVPLLCSFLLLRDKSVLAANSLDNASYLFHEENEYDNGSQTLWCSRLGDAFKFWFSLQWYGEVGYCRRVEHAFEMVTLFYENMLKNSNFEVLLKPACLQVCFYYRPSEDGERNTKMTHGIVQVLRNERKYFIDYAQGKRGDFFRIVIQNPLTTEVFIDEVIKEIDEAGKKLLHTL
ncbi:unnamed protein product [Didymodactylos carnosus]|uniref:Glutamate decarboxylase n=1 Tax=Didymodactylos carnosus TaxID=1234261 RepID=A0A814BXM0_9BILA|nr:unnamed protein product [Didymodactylos carnosus]CAF1259702.1 unnamed protein product [Didymodactylos carnosus]CAF3710216.1 unnamed protein product [Didymodactylos carnosus]CAF4066481.1 unnamed protein product [Didymodactylos carnosus]